MSENVWTVFLLGSWWHPIRVEFFGGVRLCLIRLRDGRGRKYQTIYTAPHLGNELYEYSSYVKMQISLMIYEIAFVLSADIVC